MFLARICIYIIGFSTFFEVVRCPVVIVFGRPSLHLTDLLCSLFFVFLPSSLSMVVPSPKLFEAIVYLSFFPCHCSWILNLIIVCLSLSSLIVSFLIFSALIFVQISLTRPFQSIQPVTFFCCCLSIFMYPYI